MKAKLFLVVLALSIIAACSNTKLPNGRPKYQGCAQGRSW